MRILIITFAILSGCAQPQLRSPPTQESWASQITVNRDDYQKKVTVEGGVIEKGLSFSLLRMIRSPGLPPIMQIYVMDYYSGDWRFYDRAFDSEGKELPLVSISRKVASCSRYGCGHEEHVGLDVTTDYLRARGETGIDFQISGRAGKETFYIQPAYIRAFLAAIERAP